MDRTTTFDRIYLQRLTIMSSSSVWVQLYYKGNDEAEGNPIKIRPIPEDVADLIEAAKAKLKKELDHAGLTEIDVYPPKSSGDENKYKQGKKLGEVIQELKKKSPPTSDDHPLSVVAPRQQQQANGEKCLRFASFVHSLIVVFI